MERYNSLRKRKEKWIDLEYRIFCIFPYSIRIIVLYSALCRPLGLFGPVYSSDGEEVLGVSSPLTSHPSRNVWQHSLKMYSVTELGPATPEAVPFLASKFLSASMRQAFGQPVAVSSLKKAVPQ